MSEFLPKPAAVSESDLDDLQRKVLKLRNDAPRAPATYGGEPGFLPEPVTQPSTMQDIPPQTPEIRQPPPAPSATAAPNITPPNEGPPPSPVVLDALETAYKALRMHQAAGHWYTAPCASTNGWWEEYELTCCCSSAH